VEKKQPSLWAYLGCGCLALVVAGVLAMMGGFALVADKARELEADNADPLRRTEKVKKTLGAEKLPEGYHAMMAISVPMLMDTALLSTHHPDVPENLQKAEVRAFMYVHSRSAKPTDVEELRAYLEGRKKDPAVLSRSGIDISIRKSEVLGRGTIELEGRRLLYLSQRAELRNERLQGNPSLNAIVLFECPGQDRARVGVWLAPDPSPRTPIARLDVTGTPVDVQALKAFMSHFNPCQPEG
jgi:hypothetical protein